MLRAPHVDAPTDPPPPGPDGAERRRLPDGLDLGPTRRPPGHPLAFFVALLVLYVVPGATAQVHSPAVGLAWTQIFVFLLPSVVSASASNLVPAHALLLARAPPAGVLPVAAAIGGVGFVAAGATMALVSALLPQSWVRAFDLTPLFQGPPAERLALAAVATVIAPVCEEVAFRGHLQTLLGARLRPGGAIALAALLFAVLHLDPVRFVAVFELGLVFGWLAWRAGSVWPAVAGHAANNLAATLLVLAAGARPAIDAEPRPLASLAALALGLAVLAPLLGWYRRLTPAPPRLEAALVAEDPLDEDPRFRFRRIPSFQRRLALAGIAVLVAVVAAAKLVG
jgi:membrane protease YdiL (CAAX protease family)